MMRILYLAGVVTLAQFTTLSLATPVPASGASLPVCANNPKVVAGTPWQRRSLESKAFLPVTTRLGHSEPSTLESGGSYDYHLKPTRITPRGSADLVHWCAPRTNIYITLTITHRVAANAIKDVLSEAYGIVDEILRHMGDGPVATPGFNWGTGTAVLQTWNTNNQETTWRVLAGALVALQDFMLEHRNWVGARFTVYHGALEVGKGVIG